MDDPRPLSWRGDRPQVRRTARAPAVGRWLRGGVLAACTLAAALATRPAQAA